VSLGGGGRVAFVLLEVAVLFLLPGVIAIAGTLHETFVHPLVMYAGWWVSGLLPVAYVFMAATPRVVAQRSETARTSALSAEHARILSRLLLALPLLSIVAHLSLCHWVYKSSFCLADLAPLLIGAAVAIGRLELSAISPATRMRVQLTLPMIAVALSSFGVPRDMIFPVIGVSLSPLRFALFAAAIVYLDVFWRHRYLLLALAAIACWGGVVLGSSVGAMKRNAFDLAQVLADLVDRLAPRTLHDWGVVSIGAAFVLLALGALVSLTRRVVVIHAVGASGASGASDEGGVSG
jgi:hypothetical protein